jgi:hypothetical protein
VPEPLRSQLRSLASRISADDLAEEGVEEDPHLTLLYGLHEQPAELPLAAARAFGPAPVVLGPVSVFEKPDCDVVKVEVLGEAPHRLHHALRSLPHTLSHPDYRPHLTLGYVKKGRGRKYAGRHMLQGRPYVLEDLIYSGADGQRRNARLGGFSLSAAEEENWVQHQIEHGPRAGQRGWKNLQTGHIVVGPRPGTLQKERWAADDAPAAQPRLKAQGAGQSAGTFRP